VAEEVDLEALRDQVLSQLDADNLKAICAFCGASLKAQEPGILVMEVGSTRDQARQAMFIHATCLAEQLHESVPFHSELFEPDAEG
jgi:hypothetical protein